MRDSKNEKEVENNNLHTKGSKKDKMKKAENKAIEKQGNEGSVAAELKNREHDK